MNPVGRGAPHNPFSSVRVRPGAIPFLLDDAGMDSILESLSRHGFRGQILGPHGAGKSTLLAHLSGILRARGHTVVEINAGAERIERGMTPDAVIALDSGERLSRLGWIRLRARRGPLIVTAHEPLGLPTIATLRGNFETARRVVDHLLSGSPGFRVDDDLLAALLERRAGNLRLVLFDLYDLYEQGASPGRKAAAAINPAGAAEQDSAACARTPPVPAPALSDDTSCCPR